MEQPPAAAYPPAPPPRNRVGTRGWAGAAAGLSLVVLATWLPLWFRYRPGDTMLASRPFQMEVLLALHRGVMVAVTLMAIVMTVLAVVALVQQPGRDAAVSLAVLGGAAVTGLAALVAGRVLEWEQIALAGVTVDTDARGFGAAVGSGVRFVIVSGREVAPPWPTVAAVVAWLGVIAAPALLVMGTQRYWLAVEGRSRPAAT